MPSSRRAVTLPNKIALGFLLLSVLALVGFVVVSNTDDAAEQEELASTAQVVRENSHRLSTPQDENETAINN